MGKLRGNREPFCQAYVDPEKANRVATKAYTIAYNADNMKPDTIKTEAYKLMQLDSVKARLTELDEAVTDKIEYTREQHIAKLRLIGNEAKNAGQHSAALAAEVSVGKALGMYTTKIEDVTTAEAKLAKMNPKQLDDYIEQLQKLKVVV